MSDDSLASRALLIPLVTCSPSSTPAHSCLVLSKRQELAVATEPMQERLVLQPGRYSVEVMNLDSGGGSKRTAKVLFTLELPGCAADAWTQEVVSGESVMLHLEVPVLPPPGAPHGGRVSGSPLQRGQGGAPDISSSGETASTCAKIRVLVQWKDDYQLAFAVRLVVRLELPDLDLTRLGTVIAPRIFVLIFLLLLSWRLPIHYSPRTCPVRVLFGQILVRCVCECMSAIADAEGWAATQRVRGQKMLMEVPHTRVRVTRVTLVLRGARRAAQSLAGSLAKKTKRKTTTWNVPSA